MQLVTEQMALEAADLSDVIRGVALAAIAGDDGAEAALYDWCEENHMNPFQVGESYLICTVTLYYIGRVTEAGLGWIRLEDASWVHWTGRLSVLLNDKNFRSPRLAGRRPRTEFCGQVILATSAIVSAYPWQGKLLGENVE